MLDKLAIAKAHCSDVYVYAGCNYLLCCIAPDLPRAWFIYSSIHETLRPHTGCTADLEGVITDTPAHQNPGIRNGHRHGYAALLTAPLPL